MMSARLRFALGLGLVALLSQASCAGAEDVAVAAEREIARESCSVGQLESVRACGSAEAACHVCGRLEGDSAVCLQPCTVDKNDCPGGQRCMPISGLREAGGYARVGDCPAGYCQ